MGAMLHQIHWNVEDYSYWMLAVKSVYHDVVDKCVCGVSDGSFLSEAVLVGGE